MKRIINLGKHARARNVIKNGIISLQKLSHVVLNEDLNKKSIRHSMWSNTRLSSKQLLCAGLNAIKSLQIYFIICHLEDLSV